MRSKYGFSEEIPGSVPESIEVSVNGESHKSDSDVAAVNLADNNIFDKRPQAQLTKRALGDNDVSAHSGIFSKVKRFFKNIFERIALKFIRKTLTVEVGNAEISKMRKKRRKVFPEVRRVTFSIPNDKMDDSAKVDDGDKNKSQKKASPFESEKTLNVFLAKALISMNYNSFSKHLSAARVGAERKCTNATRIFLLDTTDLAKWERKNTLMSMKARLKVIEEKIYEFSVEYLLEMFFETSSYQETLMMLQCSPKGSIEALFIARPDFVSALLRELKLRTAAPEVKEIMEIFKNEAKDSPLLVAASLLYAQGQSVDTNEFLRSFLNHKTHGEFYDAVRQLKESGIIDRFPSVKELVLSVQSEIWANLQANLLPIISGESCGESLSAQESLFTQSDSAELAEPANEANLSMQLSAQGNFSTTESADEAFSVGQTFAALATLPSSVACTLRGATQGI